MPPRFSFNIDLTSSANAPYTMLYTTQQTIVPTTNNWHFFVDGNNSQKSNKRSMVKTIIGETKREGQKTYNP
jgi:hypothetical protein